MERVIAPRKDPLRFVIFCRNSEDELRECTVALRPVINGVEAEEERLSPCARASAVRDLLPQLPGRDDQELAVAVRVHPPLFGFHPRNEADGFRVQWDMPEAAVLGAVEAGVREVTSAQGAQPTTAGYGITGSDPIRDLSYDPLRGRVHLHEGAVEGARRT